MGLGCVLRVLIVRVELVAVTILILDVAFGLIFREVTFKEATVWFLDAAATHTTIVLPLALVEVTILVVVSAGGTALVRLEDTLEEFPISKENLDLAVSHFIAIKPSFYNLTR